MRNSYMNNNGQQHHRHHHHHHPNDGVLRRRSSDNLPKSVQFDESSDSYRCLCGCFHVKTGALCIAGIELVLIFCYFLNALLVLLQQKHAYGHERSGGKSSSSDGYEYVQIAFIITSVALAIALATVLLMIVGLSRNLASLLLPHIFVQACSIVCFLALLTAGCIALSTDSAFFYRLLNAAPFNDYPGQSTVAFPIEITVRIYAILFLYLLSLLLECWFIVIIYNCNRYFTERRTYMNYCLAYSTPMKTLNSAR